MKKITKNNKFGRMRKVSQPLLSYYPSICLKRLSKIMRNLIQDGLAARTKTQDFSMNQEC
jgi:hypothetical protein